MAADFLPLWELTVVFLITALTFMPVGQLCGRLMERRTKLWAYRLNLLGSLLGVLLMLLASFLWTPPLAWFALLLLYNHIVYGANALFNHGGSFLYGTLYHRLSLWPVNPRGIEFYSPYQLLEIGRSQDTGLTLIKAAGHYYQRIHDFSDTQTRQEHDFRTCSMTLPTTPAARWQTSRLSVLGPATTLPAPLRSGAGHVEAIEIDPAILLAGKVSHPEKPYSDPRVHAVVNDARSFLRTTEQTFDLIVYGLLDLHTLLSQGSSVRLDSFVYTVEGLREARARLKPNGMLSLAFTLITDPLGRKIYLMLQEAFDGRPPLCVAALDFIIYLQSND